MNTSQSVQIATSSRQQKIHSLRLPMHQPNRSYSGWLIQRNMDRERQKRAQMPLEELYQYNLQVLGEMAETATIPLNEPIFYKKGVIRK